MGQKRFYIPEYNASGMGDENMSTETFDAIKRMVEIAYYRLNSTKPPVSCCANAQVIFLNAKYFIVDKVEECISCFISERNGGWDGYKLAIKYLHGVGYDWQLSEFWAANSDVEYAIEQKPDFFTKDKFKAASLLGLCPKCTGLLFDEFTNALHDVQKCGSPKRAVALRSEWA